MATIELRDLNPAEFNNNLIVYGKVAIGTSDLAYNGLQIKPSSGNGQLVVERASGASYQINAQASLVQVGTISNHPLQLMANSTSYVYLTTGGRFGIGTGTPNEILEVKSSGTTRIRIDSGDSGASSLDLHDNGSLGARINCDSAKNLELMAGGRTGGDLTILASNGYVGIGTGATVVARLHVRGNSDTSEDDCSIRIVDADGTSGSIIPNIQFRTDSAQIYQIRANDQLGLSFRNSSDATKVTFDQDGKVGIGETEPDYHLHVNSGGTGTVAQFKSTSTTAKIMFNNSGSNACFLGSQNNNLFFQTNSTNRMFISTAGKVGIGTTIPVANLHVEGGSSQARLIVNSNTAQDNYVAIGYGSVGSEIDVGTFLTHTSTGNTFNIDNSGAVNSIVAIKTRPSSGDSVERLRVDEDGNVGINETTPTEKLHVDGNLKVTGSVIVGSSGATTLSDAGPYDPYVLFKWEGQYYQNGGHNDPPNQYFDTQLYYADATSPWNKSSVATKSCEDLTTLVGTANFNTTYKKSTSWYWHYMLELKNTDKTNSSFPTNYMRIKMPVYYTAGASDHHVFYLKIRMDINSGYQLCVANEAGTPQKRAGCATRTAGGANTRGVGAGPRNCNAMQGHRYYGEWTNVLIAKEHINDYSFADTSSPTGRSINLTINMTGTQNSTLWFMGVAMGKNKKGVVVNGPRALFHGMAEGNNNRGQWPDGGGTNRDGLNHHGNWHYSEMIFVYHQQACFTPIQIPSTDKDLIVTVLDTGYHDHHEESLHFFLVDDDAVGVKDGTLADQSQVGRRGYNSLAPNTVYKASMMNIGSCQNMARNGIGHWGRTGMTFIIPQSEVARVAGSSDGIKHLKLGMSQVHNHWNHAYIRAIYVEEAS